MLRRSVPAAVVTLVVSLGVGWAQDFRHPQADQYFRVEWQLGQSRSGRPTVTGYVYNGYGLSAFNIRLLVEQLDAGGQPTSRTTAYVNGDVPGMGRAYFEVPVPGAGASYRVSVLWFDWQGRGGG